MPMVTKAVLHGLAKAGTYGTCLAKPNSAEHGRFVWYSHVPVPYNVYWYVLQHVGPVPLPPVQYVQDVGAIC